MNPLPVFVCEVFFTFLLLLAAASGRIAVARKAVRVPRMKLCQHSHRRPASTGAFALRRLGTIGLDDPLDGRRSAP